jgi:hypothetical protein
VRTPPSTVEPRPYTDAELFELEATARRCGKVKLVFDDGSVIERDDHIGMDRAMAIAFCRDIVRLRAELAATQRRAADNYDSFTQAAARAEKAESQLAEHDRLADETVALLRAAVDLGNKQLAEARAELAQNTGVSG